MIIYKATNTITGKSYIGQTTKSLHYRAQKHKVDSKRTDYYFHRAINKYGWGNFTWEVICECDNKDELNDKERHYIKLYDTHWTVNGYNIDRGGSNGNCLMGEDNGMYGKTHTDEARKACGDANKGKVPWNKGIPRTDEVKNTISEKNKGNTAWNKGLSIQDDKVKQYTEKRKQTMIEKGLFKSGRGASNFKKLNEDILIDLYGKISIYKLAEALGCSRQTVRNRIKLLKEEGRL